MVAGLATQAVIGNAIAGVFMALLRPVRVGDNVTTSGNTGIVVAIMLMHTILETEDREIMIPSSQIVTSVPPDISPQRLDLPQHLPPVGCPGWTADYLLLQL